MSKERRATHELKKQIDVDLRSFAQEFTHQLMATTPIRTGFARNSWSNIYSGKSVGEGGLIPLAKNTAEYIGVLDGQSPRGYWSSQAPRGIVEPALKKTRKK